MVWEWLTLWLSPVLYRSSCAASLVFHSNSSWCFAGHSLQSQLFIVFVPLLPFRALFMPFPAHLVPEESAKCHFTPALPPTYSWKAIEKHLECLSYQWHIGHLMSRQFRSFWWFAPHHQIQLIFNHVSSYIFFSTIQHTVCIVLHDGCIEQSQM